MDRKIIDYEVISGDSRPQFISNLMEFVRDGWQPYGPMLFDREGWYTQPIVRYEETSALERLRASQAELLPSAEAYYLSLVDQHIKEGTEISRLTARYGEVCHRARVLLKQPEGQS